MKSKMVFSFKVNELFYSDHQKTILMLREHVAQYGYKISEQGFMKIDEN